MYRRISSSFVALLLVGVTFGAQAQEDEQASEDAEQTAESAEPSEQASEEGEQAPEDSDQTAERTGQPSSESAGRASEGAGEASGGGGEAGANALDDGAVSLAFGVPTGGNPYAEGTAGVWYMVTDSINLGINLGVGVDSTTEINNYETDEGFSVNRTGFDLLIAPAIRYYLMNDSPVAPYILGQVNFHKYFDGEPATSADPTDANFSSELQPELALIGGFGLEWFPIERFSIGGHVGLGVDLIRQNTREGGAVGGTLTKNNVRVGTFTSGLSANIYF